MISTDGPYAWLTPIYHVFEMMRAHVGNDALLTNVDSADLSGGGGDTGSLPQVSASASLEPDGGSAVICVTNRHISESISCRLTCAGRPAASATATVLSADAPNVYNDASHSDRVTPKPHDAAVDGGEVRVDLPPHSVALVRVELQ